MKIVYLLISDMPKGSGPVITSATMSPAVRNVQGKPISKAQKILIINRLKESARASPADTKLRKVLLANSIAEEFGFSSKSVLKIINEYLTTNAVASPCRKRKRLNTIFNSLDDYEKTAIRLKIHAFFHRGEIPTIDKVLKEINDDNTMPSFKRSSFHK